MPETWSYCKVSVKWVQSLVSVQPQASALGKTAPPVVQPHMLHAK